MLIAFDEICMNNNIKYSLAYGSMIGAVRHHGFIPWDDDVDIFIVREEYQKLKSIFAHQQYELVDVENDENYPYLFPKFRDKTTTLVEEEISDCNYNIGIYLDLFVLDGTSIGFVDTIKRFKLKLLYKLYRLLVLNDNKLNFVMRFLKRVVGIFYSPHKLACKCDKIFRGQVGNKLRDVSMLYTKYYLDIKDMINIDRIMFENREFFVSRQYDAMLTRQYGDYMKLPPVEEQKSNHSFYKIAI